MVETLTEAGTIYPVGVDKIYSKVRGLDAGGRDEVGISTGVSDLQFFLSFA